MGIRLHCTASPTSHDTWQPATQSARMLFTSLKLLNLVYQRAPWRRIPYCFIAHHRSLHYTQPRTPITKPHNESVLRLPAALQSSPYYISGRSSQQHAAITTPKRPKLNNVSLQKKGGSRPPCEAFTASNLRTQELDIAKNI